MAIAVSALVLAMTSLLGWVALIALILDKSPRQPLALVALYGFLLAAVASTAALGAWFWQRGRARGARLASPAGYVPHSVLLAMMAVGALWLQSRRLLSPTAVLLFLGLYVSLEAAILLAARRQDRVDRASPRTDGALPNGIG